MRSRRLHSPLRPVLIAITVASGLGYRRFAPHLPAFRADYAKDMLWA